MIKYLVMDVDGTLTDGKIYMGTNGEIMKAFSVKDGIVINHILKPNNITPIILTARNSSIVQCRCDELGIKEVYQGKLDKFGALQEIVGADAFSNCAYFGDDILDLKCMNPIKEAGGIVACPADAAKEVKAIADYICINKAGDGALREFVEWLISSKSDDNAIKNRVDAAVKYLRQLKISEMNIGERIDVGEDFYYTIQSYDTRPEKECKLESHKKYIDIQIIVSGEERMDLVDVSRLTLKEEYNEKKDIMYWKIPSKMSKTTLLAGDCIVLYPETAHRGAQNLNEVKHVLKIVGKVKI